MTPKFSLIQDIKFHAQGDTKHQSHDVGKSASDPIKPKTQQKVECSMQIPFDQVLSIPNCEIIKVEYKLKVCNIRTAITYQTEEIWTIKNLLLFLHILMLFY